MHAVPRMAAKSFGAPPQLGERSAHKRPRIQACTNRSGSPQAGATRGGRGRKGGQLGVAGAAAGRLRPPG